VILRGTAWLDADGFAARPVTAGDVVLVAPGRRHSLRDAKQTRARPIEQLLAEGVFAPGRKPPEGVTTQVLCGCFHVEDSGAAMLLSALPAVIHLRDAPEVGPWIEHTVKLMTYEAMRERPGSETVVNRLCDALFVFVLRGVLETTAPGASWLRGLSDPHVGAALRLVHERPADPWSVASLAQKVGLSRSGFALRFAELVGEPPMQYVTRWRLHKAAELLAAGDRSIAEVAAVVGYDSESSFNKAFKRTRGVPPGAHRKNEKLKVQRPAGN
jgi:AraC-like DNA-binding protein